jgi:peroxiredoxin
MEIMENRMMNGRRGMLVMVAAIFIGGGVAGADGGRAKFNRVVAIGDRAPAWGELPGVDGKSHRLDDYQKAKVVVVVFTCNHCPVASAYEQRLGDFVSTYRAKGVELVAISVSTKKVDRLEKMKERAQQRGFRFPYLYDATQKTGRAYGATVTPHCFVLDQDRKIAYMGAFDDSEKPERVRKHYVVDAVEALLAGKSPPVRESLQRGCAIEYNTATD